MKRCPGCGEIKPLEEFYPHRGRYDRRQARCKPCCIRQAQEWRRANRDRANTAQRRRRLKKHFGITVEEYETRLEAQGGTCAVCEKTCPSGGRLAVDHDHATGVVRGLLCVQCNTALGLVDDDPALLQRLIDYLGADLRPPLAEAVAVEAGIHTGRQSSGLLESQE